MGAELATEIRNRDGHVVAPEFVAALTLNLRLLTSQNPIAMMALLDVAKTGDSHLFDMSKDTLVKRQFAEVRDGKPYLDADMEAAVKYIDANHLLAG